MKRKLLDGTEAPEFDFPIQLIVLTRCPSKYKLIDMETGEEYIGIDSENSHWDKIEKKVSKDGET